MNWLTSRCAPLAVLATLALAGCDKGTDLNVSLPDTAGTNTNYLDLDVVSGTVRLAPVQTLKADHFLVGRLTDNIAGTTEARAYFNVIEASDIVRVSTASGLAVTDSLPSTLASATVTPVLDSVVIVMGFDRVYGSTTTPAKFDVFDLAAPLDDRQGYDSNSSTAAGTPLGLNLTSRLDRTTTQIVKIAVAATPTAAGTPAITTTVPDQTVRLVVQRTATPAVTSGFATALFDRLKQPGFTQTQLDAVLKGLAILPSASHTGSIVAFSKSYKARMLVYYHAGAANRSYSLYFGPAYSGLGYASTRDPRYYTQIVPTLPNALAVLNNRSGFVPSAVLNGTTYVQEGIGLGTRITFTGLTALMDKPGLTINRAEIRVPIKPFSNALLFSPRFLYAVEVDANNEIKQRTIGNLPVNRLVQADGFDQLLATSPAFGSITDLGTTQGYYSIPVTSYLQAYLGNKLGGNPDALVLMPSTNDTESYSALINSLYLSRAAIDAPNIKLRVYYSQR